MGYTRASPCYISEATCTNSMFIVLLYYNALCTRYMFMVLQVVVLWSYMSCYKFCVVIIILEYKNIFEYKNKFYRELGRVNEYSVHLRRVTMKKMLRLG